MLSTEPNNLRKSHRVSLPMRVTIGERTYRVRDWSLTGIGVEGFTETLGPDEVLEAILILPMTDSTLSLRVALRFVRRHGEVAGFEYHELSQRNRRILRHYIELAVEGKLDNVEDLIAVATAPEINTPIQDALNLSDLEEENLVARFRLHSTFSITVAVIFVLLVIATLFYNTTYRISATGVVAGNLRKISAGVNGLVTRVQVHENALVEPRQPLVGIRDEQFDRQMASLEQRQQQLREKLAILESSKDDPHVRLLEELHTFARVREEELERARKLFSERLITSKDLGYVENQYRQAMLNLTRELESSRAGDHASEAERAVLRKSLEELDRRIAELRSKGAVRTVLSPVSGMVFNLPVEVGQRVTAGTTVVLLEEDKTPFVLIRLLNSDAIKLKPGMKANVVVPFLDREYGATVEAIGYSAVNSEVSFSQEASLNETLVKLVLDDPDVRLPANTRVKVWIQTFQWPTFE